MAAAGAAVAVAAYRNDPEAKQKTDGSWVTEADEAAERTIREMIAEQFPEHNILGEEEGLSAAAGGPSKAGAPTWIVDPIDGTHNFMAGVPIWGTLVGLQYQGEMILGVAHAPMLNEVYDAGRGLGARMNGDPIHVSDVTDLADSMLVTTGFESYESHELAEFYVHLARATHRSRGLGDFWGHMLVARGAADLMVEPVVATWDFAPLVAIVEEAGGTITQVTGEAYTHEGSLMTTNGHLHDEVVALYNGLRR